MTTLHLDFETRSVVDLREVGLYRYLTDPHLDVWCMAWAFDDEDPVVWAPGMPIPARLLRPIDRVESWNVNFEYEIWNHILAKRYGFARLEIEKCYCTQAMANAMGLPGALDDAAGAIGLDYRKDIEGRALMLRMTRPRKIERNAAGDVVKLTWWDEVEKRMRLYEYCCQDVRVEQAMGKHLVPLSARERRVWLVDNKINRRGVQVDVESAKAAVRVTEEVKTTCDAALAEITGGAVQTVTAIAAIKSWMQTQGVAVDSLNKQAVVDMLAQGSEDIPGADLPEPVRKVLLLRQEAGKASAAKFDVMVRAAGDDGRLRGMYYYHGASTGRWSGRLVQTHNLPRDMPPRATVEKILALVRKGQWRVVDMLYGPPITMLSKSLRAFFVAPEGRKLIHGDWSNVEGRGDAWFAGEQWKLDAFRAADEKRGPGLYELAYSRMFGVPVESVKDPSEERQIGKVSELAFARGGGVGSFRTMAKSYPDMRVQEMSDEKINGFKEAWRDAHTAIAGARNERGYRQGGMWHKIEVAALNAVMQPGEKFECGAPGRQATFLKSGSFLWCLLPSGRVICYPFPKILEGPYGPQLTYMCVPSQEDRKKNKIIHDIANASNWARVATYGGALFGHIVQGFCRDFLADLLVWLDEQGADIVMHTHDDANTEVSEANAEGARKLIEERMNIAPAWAKDFPLFAKCVVLDRYGK